MHMAAGCEINRDSTGIRRFGGAQGAAQLYVVLPRYASQSFRGHTRAMPDLWQGLLQWSCVVMRHLSSCLAGLGRLIHKIQDGLSHDDRSINFR